MGWNLIRENRIMLESFNITLQQTLVLFSYILIGYWLKKSGKVTDTFSKGLSSVLVNVFVPFLTFGSMAKNFKLNVLSDKLSIVLVGIGLLCFFLVVGFVFSRTFAKKPTSRDVLMYSFSIPNVSYFGNPLVLAVLGELALFDFIILCIPFYILSYTYGIYLLNPNRQFSFKNLINPVMISLILGIVVGTFDITMPAFIQSVIDAGSGCMAPSAMILTGMVFASNNLKEMLINRKAYLACILKMFVLSVIAVFVFVITKIPEDMSVLLVIMFTLPTGLNSIVFPEAFGGDSRTGAQLCFVSTMMCLVFIPMFLSLYNMMC